MLRTFTSFQWKLLLDAYGIAGQVLNFPKARAAVLDGMVNKPVGLAGNGDPRSVLKDIFARAKITHQHFGYGVSLDSKATSILNLAFLSKNRGIEYDDQLYNKFAAAGTKEHSGGYIRIGISFFNLTEKQISALLIWGTGGNPKLSNEWARALILLHEVKHIITGAYHRNHDIAFNTKIYDEGFKNFKVKK